MAQPDLERNFTKGRFQDRVYVVTGATSGIGLATVERLCNDGATVAMFARNQDRGKEVESRLQAQEYRVRFYQVDVSREEECERGVQEVVRDFGEAIHGLVNNAGIFEPGDKSSGEEVSSDHIETILGINLKGSLYMVKSCLPYLKKGSAPAIVNISGMVNQVAMPHRWTHQSTRGGLCALTRSMALDLNAYGIRVNCVNPGIVWTPILEGAAGERSAAEPSWGKMNMMGRFGEASELAGAIAFLLSKDASFITGANLAVDGGTTAMCPPVGSS